MDSQQIEETGWIGDDLPTGDFCIHSRFNTVLNFINGENAIAYITSGRDNLASNAVFLPGIDLDIVESLNVFDERILVNDRVFFRKNMAVYDSRINFEKTDAEEFESRLYRIISEDAVLFPGKSLLFLLDPDREKCFTDGFDLHFMQNAKQSVEMIMSGDTIGGVKSIRGTGYGLTPSGDDFIAGLLLGTYYNEWRFASDLSQVRERIYAAALGSSHLTNAFLRNAKNGKCHMPLKKVLLLLCGEKASHGRKELEKLLSLGSTSGADFFSGYIFSIKHKTGI